ncbi:MAG: recombinase family protein [Desulfobulbus sp.]|nr:recombinase family protein [Desulfobulbus sp.]
MQKPDKPKLAGIWIRVSTDEQAQGESPENHLKRAQMYCEPQGWQPAAVYDLSGVSGKTVIDHPEAQRMLADLELLDIADRFQSAGAALLSIFENLDTSTPAGTLMYTLIGALAEWERAEISARVAAESVPVRAAQGKPTCGAGPWGYRREATATGKRLVVDDQAADKIKKIFAIAIEEKGDILRAGTRLNAMGLRTRKGALFGVAGLKRLIDDPVYIGRKRANYAKSAGDGKRWVQKPESEWVYHNAPAIITQEQWDQLRIHRMVRRAGCRSDAPPKESRCIFGEVLWRQCGCKMYVYHVKNDGDAVYLCRKCDRKAGEAELTANVQEAFRKVIIKPDVLVLLDRHPGDDPDNLRAQGRALMEEAEKLQKKKSGLFELALIDPLVKAELMNQLRDLAERIEALQAEALRLGEEADWVMLTRAGYGPLLEQATQLTDIKGSHTVNGAVFPCANEADCFGWLRSGALGSGAGS